MNQRPDIDNYALAIAHVVKLRSEDPYLQVGAVAVNNEGRIVGTGYNGLKTGMTLPPEVWADRDLRRRYIIHAEINVCSLIRRGDATTLAITSSPCESCANAIVAAGFKRVIYTHAFRDDSGIKLLNFYGVDVVQYDYDFVKNLITAGL